MTRADVFNARVFRQLHFVVKKRSEKDDEAEVEYLARAMADVVPLPPAERGRVRGIADVGGPRVAAAASADSRSSSEDIEERTDAAFAAPGVDRRELTKLKRGEHVPGRRLDLHGLTTLKALASVRRFIDEARHRHRCICIVHGRGLHSEGNVPILKARVRECLGRHRAVLAYTDAPRTDGGSGAVYVLLRK